MASDPKFSDWYFTFCKEHNRTPSQEEVWNAALAQPAPVQAGAQQAVADDEWLARAHDALETLEEEGWIWDGDQFQRPPATAPVQKGAGHDQFRELHDLLYTAQRIEGAQRDKAISRARMLVHHLRDSAQSCLTPEHLKGAATTQAGAGDAKGGA